MVRKFSRAARLSIKKKKILFNESWTLRTTENNEDRKIVWECGMFKIYSTISFGLMFLYFAYLCIVFFFFDWFLSMPASYLVKKQNKNKTLTIESCRRLHVSSAWSVLQLLEVAKRSAHSKQGRTSSFELLTAMWRLWQLNNSNSEFIFDNFTKLSRHSFYLIKNVDVFTCKMFFTNILDSLSTLSEDLSLVKCQK